MSLIIIFMPFINFVLCLFFGRNLGKEGVRSITFINFSISIGLLLTYSFYVLWGSNIIEEILWKWIEIKSSSIYLSINLDHITCSMLILVYLVSFFVHIFSFSYMGDDPHFQRFIGYLSLFTFFMIILIISNNLLQLFIGWEGVGLCSYLLINFWFTRIEANKASIKAMVINKIGDLGLLLGILLIWHLIGSIDYKSIFCSLNNFFQSNINSEIIGILLLIGVIGKSAQIGLHTWLPDAMEGPTPVSALIHAATMVTAGVFLVVRISPLFDILPLTSLIITILGSLTCVISALIALPQKDLKKVIAYSTCSQLGYMVLICGFSCYDVSLFHLINHGFFKALLFLSAGSIIHINYDEQDLRKLGGIKFISPISYICFLIGSLSLMGLPFLTGFFSKDLIIELIYSNHTLAFAFWLSLFVVFLTSFYSFKLLFSSFLIINQSPSSITQKHHESDKFITLPLIMLSVLSIVIGFFIQPIILIENYNFSITSSVKFTPLLLTLLAIITYSTFQYNWSFWSRYKIKRIIINIYTLLLDAIFFNLIINTKFYKLLLKSGFQTYINLDNQILEKWGPKKLHSFYYSSSSKLSWYHSGNLWFYIITFVLMISLCLFSIIF